jgi:hypothetical protein
MPRSIHSHCEGFSKLARPSSRPGAARAARSTELRPCLFGLSSKETAEFDGLVPPLLDNENVGWIFEGKPTSSRQKRWLRLYRKHQEAVAAWMRLTKLVG